MASASGDRKEHGGALRSKYARDPEMADLVRCFVDELPERVQRLQAAWEEANLHDLRLLAQRLQGSSNQHGFAPLGDAAEHVVERISTLHPPGAFKELDRLGAEVRDLIAMCERVR
jgi:Hpt domain